MRAGCWLTGIVLCCALAAVGQEATGSIEGKIVDGVTGLPIAGITVSAISVSATTGADGHYALRGLADSVWVLFVRPRDGYSLRVRLIRISGGAQLKGIDIPLWKESVISGRVVDRERNPVVGAMVMVVRRGYRNGRPALDSFHSARTNKAGEYRVEKLLPGSYIIEVEPAPIQIQKLSGDAAEPEPVLQKVRTYYPNSPTPDGATVVTVAPGQNTEALDISLIEQRTVCMTSKVIAPGLPRNTLLAVTVSGVSPGAMSRIAFGTFEAGDDIQVCSIPPGTWRLWAGKSPEHEGGITFFGSQIFSVTDWHVRVPPLNVVATQPVRGMLVVAGTKQEDALSSGIGVDLDPKDRIPQQGEQMETTADSTGHFTFRGVFIGDDYWLNLQDLPPGFYVRNATIAGRDAWIQPARITGEELRIELASDGATLRGQLLDSENHPVGDATIVLAEWPLPAKIAPNRLLTTATDQTGAFSITGIPPGDYRIKGFDLIPYIKAGDPDFIRANFGDAVKLELGPNALKTLSLTLAGK